jgi:hypothetical protein
MYDFMHANEEAANKTLAPEQKAVTYGDYWCRFYQLRDRIVIFGQVTPLSYWDEKITNAADNEEQQEWQWEKEQIEGSHERGYVFGWAWSVLEPEGEPGSTHQANLWPITPALFEAARDAEWKIDDLTGVHRESMETVYQVWRAHQQSIREGRPVQ